MKTDALMFHFTLKEATSAFAEKNGKTTLRIAYENEKLSAELYYDFAENPLTLSAKAKVQDDILIVCLPHCITLLVNNTVKDEEWPAGNLLFVPGDTIEASVDINVSVGTPPVISDKKEQFFQNAEGWQPEENVFVGDCMPYLNNNTYHVLYLKDRRHHKSKWGLGAHQWEHIATKDFKTWEIYPMAVPITKQEEGSICTGSWMKNGNKEYLFYTVRMADRSPAKICRSVSFDGRNFEKDENFAFTLSDKYHKPSARDPKVFLADDGLFHMILTTSLVKENRGCLAHLVSKDLETFTEMDEPIYVSETELQPECPDYISFKGFYYLIFSLNGEAHYKVSSSPFNNWRVPENDIIPCYSVPKGAVWDNKIVFTGFKMIESYAGTMTFLTADCDENGALVFETE